MSKITEALQKAVRERENTTGLFAGAGVSSIADIDTEAKINTETTEGDCAIDNNKEEAERLSDNVVFLNGNSDSAACEGFRILRANLQAKGNNKCILITSASEKDGKSFVALNLACSMAQNGDSVLLVDANIMRPAVAGMIGIDNMPGLMEIIAVNAKWQNTVRKTIVKNLCAIPAGYSFKNYTELFGGERLDSLLAEWKREFNFIIMDAGSVCSDAGTILLSQKVQSVIFTVKMFKTSRRAVVNAKDVLKKVNVGISGFVFTDVKSYVPKVINRIMGE